MNRRLVILDRDGVINQDSDEYIKNESEWVPITGSIEAISRLKKNGFLVAVATNQSGIRRKYFSTRTLSFMHNKLSRYLLANGCHIDGLFFCPHIDSDRCDCRKPHTLLYKRISEYFGVELNNIPVVGDSPRDLAAAFQCHAKPILVLTGKGKASSPKVSSIKENIPVFKDLEHAVDAIIANAV
ncbi:MAG: D-glycero-beta-D-manno-heptose 1,7-bisphosphate 7-phosphatase [Gammaproteobacteria bacterium]|nr:D-glycero-beta-D-manno-heptose 1,7-bisphosphate 7-phosphatase [Gammaproteobacteria bacterium]